MRMGREPERQRGNYGWRNRDGTGEEAMEAEKKLKKMPLTQRGKGGGNQRGIATEIGPGREQGRQRGNCGGSQGQSEVKKN